MGRPLCTCSFLVIIDIKHIASFVCTFNYFIKKYAKDLNLAVNPNQIISGSVGLLMLIQVSTLYKPFFTDITLERFLVYVFMDGEKHLTLEGFETDLTD